MLPRRSLRPAPVIVLLAAGPALAQDWALRDGDAALTAAEIEAEIIGRTLVFYDDGQSKFSAGGAYSYTYDGGGTAFGHFEVGENGVICIDYPNGWSRCDMYVRNGDRLVLLTEKGERFPIRP